MYVTGAYGPLRYSGNAFNVIYVFPFHALRLPSTIKCYCGDEDYEQHEESYNCSFRCLGDADDFCGGPHVTSIYSVHDASIIGEKWIL